MEGEHTMKGKVISINNQKGGVGKTTTALSMAATLAKLGKKVLLVDCDGNSFTLTKILSRQINVNYETIPITLTDMILCKLMGKNVSELIGQSIIHCPEGYDFISGDSNLVTVSSSLMTRNDPETRFRTLSSIIELYKDKYEYILLDAPPVLDLFSINQLIASDELLIVSQCQEASREAVLELLKTIKKFVLPVNSGLVIKGILLTMLAVRLLKGF